MLRKPVFVVSIRSILTSISPLSNSNFAEICNDYKDLVHFEQLCHSITNRQSNQIKHDIYHVKAQVLSNILLKFHPGDAIFQCCTLRLKFLGLYVTALGAHSYMPTCRFKRLLQWLMIWECHIVFFLSGTFVNALLKKQRLDHGMWLKMTANHHKSLLVSYLHEKHSYTLTHSNKKKFKLELNFQEKSLSPYYQTSYLPRER